MDLHSAVSRTRSAVRQFFAVAEHVRYADSGEIYVAVSGGADSLALVAASAYVGRQREFQVHALIVDHDLQAGSATIARTAADNARILGAHTARLLTVRVADSGGPEAAARKARYSALRDALPAGAIAMLGHTQDDQAETVLLGMGRGSGARSMAGMRPLAMPWARPFLDISRKTTTEACRALGVTPWQDPHNTDPRFTRVRLRTEVLPLLEDVLSGGVSAALARTARQLRDDNDALDVVADDLYASVTHPDGLEVSMLKNTPSAIRRRVFRRWLIDGGVADFTDAHLRSVDALIGQWRGQGGVWLPGDFVVDRAHGRLRLIAARDEACNHDS